MPLIFIMESMIEHVAKSLGKDPLEVRKLNLYTQGQVGDGTLFVLYMMNMKCFFHFSTF